MPPENSSTISDREQKVGIEEVRYICEYQGIPAPILTWYYNGQVISSFNGNSNATRISISDTQLVISDPQLENAGIYQCIARNNITNEQRQETRVWILELRLPCKFP